MASPGSQPAAAAMLVGVPGAARGNSTVPARRPVSGGDGAHRRRFGQDGCLGCGNRRGEQGSRGLPGRCLRWDDKCWSRQGGNRSRVGRKLNGMSRRLKWVSRGFDLDRHGCGRFCLRKACRRRVDRGGTNRGRNDRGRIRGNCSDYRLRGQGSRHVKRPIRHYGPDQDSHHNSDSGADNGL